MLKRVRLFRSFAVSPGLKRLLAVRLTSQISDGAFQAALVFSALFNPERHAAALAVAGGFAVLLLPYSVIGPFAGALLDRWDRRMVLVVANLLRAAAIVLVGLAVYGSGPDVLVLLAALVVTGAGRFVHAGLSAALPTVARPEVIVGMNALFATLGAGLYAAGTGVTVLLRSIFGAGNTGSGIVLFCVAVIPLFGAAIALGFRRLQLGPERSADDDEPPVAVVSRGLGDGVRTILGTRSLLATLGGLGLHRFVFGANTLLLLFLVRNHGLTGGLGSELGAMGLVGAGIAVGAFVAAWLTPLSVRLIGRRVTVVLALTVGAAAQASLLSFHLLTYVIASVFLGLIGQVLKLCGDVAMQTDVTDHRRGRVFSVQDAFNNMLFVAAVTIAAAMVTPDGRVPVLVAVTAGLYALGAVAVRIVHPLLPPAPVTVADKPLTERETEVEFPPPDRTPEPVQ